MAQDHQKRFNKEQYPSLSAGLAFRPNESASPFSCPYIAVALPPLPPDSTKHPKVIIHCVRHAHAEHNDSKTPNRWAIMNPALTMLGHKQSELLRKNFEPMSRITHIVVSPMKRTLQTARIAFEPLLLDGLTFVAWPQLREWGYVPCSIGDKLKVLKEFINHNPVDLSDVQEGWEAGKKLRKEDRYKDSRPSDVRIQLWKLGCKALEEKEDMVKEKPSLAKFHSLKRFGRRESDAIRQDVEILVVSHADFLGYLVRDPNSPAEKTRFHNSTYRSFEFPSFDDVKHGGYKPWDLIETKESKSRYLNTLSINDSTLKCESSEEMKSKLPIWRGTLIEQMGKLSVIDEVEEEGEISEKGRRYGLSWCCTYRTT